MTDYNTVEEALLDYIGLMGAVILLMLFIIVVTANVHYSSVNSTQPLLPLVVDLVLVLGAVIVTWGLIDSNPCNTALKRVSSLDSSLVEAREAVKAFGEGEA